jgi:serine/threonine protein kinase
MEALDHIGKYEIGRKLGQGGFGEIYAGRDTELGRELAIKVLRPEHTQRPQVVQRFLQEARAAARISHPGIVTVFECGQTDDRTVYIAMELLVGETLAARIKRELLPLPTVIALTRQLAAALAAAHASGIIHRDLKPQNVFLVPDAAAVGGVRVKILDFGIAKLSDTLGSNIQTHSMEMMGTPLYMSPEQCKSSANVDGRSDIYALGCILFELASGRTPFEGDAGELIAKHQLIAPPQLHDLVTGVPPALEDLVARMLAKSPADRPQTMDDVTAALDAIAPTATGPLARITPPVPPDAQFAPTLAPGGTFTDPRALQSAPTTPLRPTPATPATPASSAIPPTTPPLVPPVRRSRMPLALIGAVLVAAGVVGAFAAQHHAAAPSPSPSPSPSPAPAPEPDAAMPIVIDVQADAAVVMKHHSKHTTDASGDDDDDDDDEKPPVPPVPPFAGLENLDIPGLGKCAKYIEASVDAKTKGDDKAALAAATALAACESGVFGKSEGKNCDALVAAGKAAEAHGDHTSALTIFEQAYACKADSKTLGLAFMAACNGENADQARRWWKLLTASAQNKLVVICTRNHITRDELDAK